MIAIVGILIALRLPALSSARESEPGVPDNINRNENPSRMPMTQDRIYYDAGTTVSPGSRGVIVPGAISH